MIIDLNILKKLGKRFGVFPISKGSTPLQAALQKPGVVFIKAPAGIEPAFTGGGYQWDDELNGYRFGNQKLFLAPDGTTIWTFKDILFRGLNLDSVQKWTSGDDEYPMGKANAFFIVYGKLTGQDLGEGATAGDNVADGETEPGDGGGLATAEDETPYSKQDVQNILKGQFPAGATGPKASMDTSIPTSGEELSVEEPSAVPSGPPPDRSKVGNPPPAGSEADNIIKTLYKKAKIDPKAKLSKQNPIRIDPDEIIDLYRRAKTLPPEEKEKLIAFLKSGAVKPLEEGKIAKYQLQGLMEAIVGGIVNEVEKAKKKTKEKAPSSQSEEPSHSQMDWEPSAESPQRKETPDYGEWLIAIANKLWKDPLEIGHGRYSWRIRKTTDHPEGPMYLLQKEKEVVDRRLFTNRNGKWFWFNPDERPIENRKWHELGMVHSSDEPSIEQETTLDEMTTTSGGGGSSAGTPGYNIPGAFSGRKMRDRKGHIEVLGYKMTPEGEKEYKREGDKLYESIKKQIKRTLKEASGLGRDFDRAQRAYDAQMPPEEYPMIACPKCGEEEVAHITKKGSKGSSWWWEAVCSKCGHKFGDDNL